MLAEIGHWHSRKDFPVKASKGWLVTELLAWYEKVTPEFAAKKARAAIFDPETNIKPSDLKIAQTIGLPQSSGITLGGESKLSGGAATPPEIIEGLTRLATWIQDYFKIPCSKQTIKNWQTETPPFPNAVSADYRYRWSEVKAWVERHKMAPMRGNGRTAELLGELEPARIQNELEEIEHDRMMRAVEAGAYLKKSEVARACQGIGKIINGTINNRLELRARVAAIERLKQRPTTPPLTEAQAAAVVDIFCDLGRETSAVLKAELRTALHQLSAVEPAATETKTKTTN
jgi:hypothetical protein